MFAARGLLAQADSGPTDSASQIGSEFTRTTRTVKIETWLRRSDVRPSNREPVTAPACSNRSAGTSIAAISSLVIFLAM